MYKYSRNNRGCRNPSNILRIAMWRLFLWVGGGSNKKLQEKQYGRKENPYYPIYRQKIKGKCGKEIHGKRYNQWIQCATKR